MDARESKTTDHAKPWVKVIYDLFDGKETAEEAEVYGTILKIQAEAFSRGKQEGWDDHREIGDVR